MGEDIQNQVAESLLNQSCVTLAAPRASLTSPQEHLVSLLPFLKLRTTNLKTLYYFAPGQDSMPYRAACLTDEAISERTPSSGVFRVQ